MPERVLHILGTAQFEGTGVARIVSALARGLDPTRYKLHACFLNGGGPLSSALQADGVQVHVVNWARGVRDLSGAWRFWRKLRGEEFAIIHQHWGGRAPRRLARWLSHAKVISHLHGHIIESTSLEPFALRPHGSDLVITTSHAVADCVVGARARVVYPGVKVPNNRRGVQITSRTSSKTVLGTAGRLVPLKGIVYLIRALSVLRKNIPGVHLEIAGSGPEQSALEHEISLQRLEDCVCFLGWQTDLRRLMATWDVYVQPSLGEPFGITALEAMAAGLPVVATAAGGLPELVEHGRTGWLVPPRDPVALADRLRALLLHPDQRHSMGSAGRARAREMFSLDRMVRDISSIYDEVLTWQ